MLNMFTFGRCPNCRAHIFFSGFKVKRINSIEYRYCPRCGTTLIIPRFVRYLLCSASAIWIVYLIVLPTHIKLYLWRGGDLALILFLMFLCLIVSWAIGYKKLE